MNETKSLEEHLQSWTPRRPSSELKARLFGHTAPEEQVPWNRVFPWLVPAMACLVVAFGIMASANKKTPFSNTNTSALFAMIGSNSVSNPFERECAVASAAGGMEFNVWVTASCPTTNEQFSTANKPSGLSRSLMILLQ